jgi:hypothetical protein
MGWVSERLLAINEAAGHRRYVIGAIITAALAVFDNLKPILGNLKNCY